MTHTDHPTISSAGGPLADREQLTRYCMDLAARMRRAAEDRVAFLTEAAERLSRLNEQALLLRLTAISSELSLHLEAVEVELRSLAPLANGDAGTSDLETGLGSTPDAETRGDQAIIGSAARTESGSDDLTDPTRQIGVPTQAAAIPESPGTPDVSQPSDGAGPGPTAPVRVKPRTWTPRGPDELEAELSEIRDTMQDHDPATPAGLLWIKVQACRLRRIEAETAAHGVSAQPIRDVRRGFLERVTALPEPPYCLPFNDKLTTDDPRQWQSLVKAYENMIPAEEAMEWCETYGTRLKPKELQKLLEAVSACQLHVKLALVKHFGYTSGDVQASQLYRRIESLCEDLGVAVNGKRTPEAGMLILASDVPDLLLGLQHSLAKQEGKDASLAKLHALLAEPEFGLGDGDDLRLHAACRECLDAGVYATQKELRNPLLDWIGYLEGAEGLEVLVRELEKEFRRLSPNRADDDADTDEPQFSPELEAMRTQLLEITRGKRLLMVGGHTSEAHRLKIQDALELAEVLWPDTDRFDTSPETYGPQLAGVDFAALLVRFMRKGMKGVKRIGKEHGVRIIHLKRGLGVNRVISDFHDQLMKGSSAVG